MKKLIALILVLSLLAGALLCFASCDGNKDTGNTDNEGGNTNTEQGGDDAGNGGDTGNGGNNGDNGGDENTEPDLTDDTYPEDVANDIF